MYDYDCEGPDGNYIDDGCAPMRATRRTSPSAAPASTRRTPLEIAREDER